MESLLDELTARQEKNPEPVFIGADGKLYFSEIMDSYHVDLTGVGSGDVVALIGDFNARDLCTLLRLFDMGAIVAPLTASTRSNHDYFFEAAMVDVVIEGKTVRRIRGEWSDHAMLAVLRERDHPGLILFSSGTTGRPKAGLHDFTHFLARFRTPRPALKTLNFLLFDHIGGINTLLHTLYNRGIVVTPSGRLPEQVVRDIETYDVELLPTTPSFLRMMLLSGLIQPNGMPSLKVVTYGTEKMDQHTLQQLCNLMPDVDFRQTYGMSELGILRVKSKARDSLWMKVGGEGVEIRVVEGVLQIRSANRMIGYLNAPSPFDDDGWYDTGDVVSIDGEFIEVVGRVKQIINVGGLKVLPTEIERIALEHPDVLRAKAEGIENRLTGQHIEVMCEPRDGAILNRSELRAHFANHLSEELRPHRIRIGSVPINHRFKQA